MYKTLIWIINVCFILSDYSCCIYSLLYCSILKLKNYLYIDKHIYVNYVIFLHTPNVIFMKLTLFYLLDKNNYL